MCDEDYQYEDYQYEEYQDNYGDDIVEKYKKKNNEKKNSQPDFLSISEIMPLIGKEIDEISIMLNIDFVSSLMILQNYKYNKTKIMEDFINSCSAESFLKRKNLQILNFENSNSNSNFICLVCFENKNLIKTSCNHNYCQTCWQLHIESQIEQGNLSKITCMDCSCMYCIDMDFLKTFCSKEQMARFQYLVMKNYIEKHENFKFCKKCEIILTGEKLADVECKCGYNFCFNCLNEAHFPCSCENMKKWTSKAEQDELTFKYLKENTKECPKCKTVIEKNGGNFFFFFLFFFFFSFLFFSFSKN